MLNPKTRKKAMHAQQKHTYIYTYKIILLLELEYLLAVVVLGSRVVVGSVGKEEVGALTTWS